MLGQSTVGHRRHFGSSSGHGSSGRAVHLCQRNVTASCAQNGRLSIWLTSDSVKHSSHCSARPRELQVFTTMMTLFASLFSGYTVIGVPNEAFQEGWFALRWTPTASMICIGQARPKAASRQHMQRLLERARELPSPPAPPHPRYRWARAPGYARRPSYATTNHLRTSSLIASRASSCDTQSSACRRATTRQ